MFVRLNVLQHSLSCIGQFFLLFPAVLSLSFALHIEYMKKSKHMVLKSSGWLKFCFLIIVAFLIFCRAFVVCVGDCLSKNFQQLGKWGQIRSLPRSEWKDIFPFHLKIPFQREIKKKKKKRFFIIALILEKRDLFPKVSYSISASFIINFIINFVKDRGLSLMQLVTLICFRGKGHNLSFKKMYLLTVLSGALFFISIGCKVSYRIWPLKDCGQIH